MTDPKPIRVMLVDDHAVVRSGLSAFLMAFDDLELVGEASGGEKAVELCQEAQPDVILMDLVMPGMDGSTATGISSFRRHRPSATGWQSSTRVRTQTCA